MTAPAPSPTSTTPILDRLMPPPPLIPKAKSEKSRWIGLAVAIIAVLVPVLWIYLMMHSASVLRWSSKITPPINQFMQRLEVHLFPPGASEALMIWHVLAMGVALLPILVVHELGHVIAGKLTGFSFVAMHFGQLQVTSPFHFKWLQKDPHPETPASVMLLPVYSQGLRSRSIIMILGGPAANFISALPVVFMPHPGVFLIWFATLSVVTGLSNLVPYSLRADSDGKKILQLLRNPREQKRALAILQLVEDLLSGTEPENLRPDFLAIATAVKDNSIGTVLGHDIAYTAAYYRHDDEEAARVLEICLQYSGCAPQQIREAVFGHAACFQAIRRKRVDLGRQWLADIPEKTVSPEQRPTIEAYVLAAEGDIQGALKKLDEAEIFRQPKEPRYDKLFLHFQQKMRQDLTSSVPGN